MEHDDLLASAVMEEILALAKKYPSMPLATAVNRVMPGFTKGYVTGPPSAIPEKLGSWAYNNVPAVKENILSNKLIMAIKELRAHTGCGLKEAKEACEYVKYTIMAQPATYAPSPKGQSLKHLYAAAQETETWTPIIDAWTPQSPDLMPNYSVTDAKFVAEHYGAQVQEPTNFVKITGI